MEKKDIKSLSSEKTPTTVTAIAESCQIAEFQLWMTVIDSPEGMVLGIFGIPTKVGTVISLSTWNYVWFFGERGVLVDPYAIEALSR